MFAFCVFIYLFILLASQAAISPWQLYGAAFPGDYIVVVTD